MSRKVPHCTDCPFLRDRGFAEYCRRTCSHPAYFNPIYVGERTFMIRFIPAVSSATSPRWCPLRGCNQEVKV